MVRKFFVTLTICLFISFPVYASSPHGSWSFNPNVGGALMSCNDNTGKPVVLIVNNGINDVGQAFPGTQVIHMNGNVLDQLPYSVVQFWYAHECAHHALYYPSNQSESASDCWAVKALRGFGLINNQYQLQQLVNTMLPLAGDMSHLPGPQRAQLIKQCWNTLV